MSKRRLRWSNSKQEWEELYTFSCWDHITIPHIIYRTFALGQMGIDDYLNLPPRKDYIGAMVAGNIITLSFLRR